MALLTEQAVADLIATASPPPPAPAAPAIPQFDLPAPIPQTRYFGGRSTSRTIGTSFTDQERYREAVMRQEADRQAQELMIRLPSPDAPDAPQQRLNLITQFPLAPDSPYGKNVLSAWDKEADRYHKGLKDDPSLDLLPKLAQANASDSMIQSIYDANGRINTTRGYRLLGELERLQKAENKVTKTEEELLDEDIEDLTKMVEARDKLLIGVAPTPGLTAEMQKAQTDRAAAERASILQELQRKQAAKLGLAAKRSGSALAPAAAPTMMEGTTPSGLKFRVLPSPPSQ